MEMLWRDSLYYMEIFMHIVKDCMNSLRFIPGGKW